MCKDCGQETCICGLNNVSMETPKFPCWVNVYHVCLAKGGPEEGGWWYDEGSIEETVQIDNQEQLDFILKMMKDRYELTENNTYLYKDQYDHPNFDRERNRDYSSVLSTGEYRIYVQPTKGENFPQERPHYE